VSPSWYSYGLFAIGQISTSACSAAGSVDTVVIRTLGVVAFLVHEYATSVGGSRRAVQAARVGAVGIDRTSGDRAIRGSVVGGGGHCAKSVDLSIVRFVECESILLLYLVWMR
jgi:hypothetical protein